MNDQPTPVTPAPGSMTPPAAAQPVAETAPMAPPPAVAASDTPAPATLVAPPPPVAVSAPAVPAAPAAPVSSPVGTVAAMPGPLSLTAVTIDKALDSALRFGLGGVFLINGLTALLSPQGFLDLIHANIIGQMIGHFQLQIYAIAVNDFGLGLLLISGFKKKYVFAWAGMWLLIVTFFKSTSLF